MKCSILYVPFHKHEELSNIQFGRGRGASQMLLFWGHHTLNLLATDFFFQILAHPVFKM